MLKSAARFAAAPVNVRFAVNYQSGKSIMYGRIRMCNINKKRLNVYLP